MVAHSEGGHDIVLPAPVTYLIGEIGVVMIFGSGAVLIGVALIAVAFGAGLVLPAWLRWLTVIAGVGAIAGPAFFPFFLLIVWGVAAGVWLLTAAAIPHLRRRQPRSTSSRRSSRRRCILAPLCARARVRGRSPCGVAGSVEQETGPVAESRTP